MNSKEKSQLWIKTLFLHFLLIFVMISSPFVSADGGGTYSVYDTNRDGYLDNSEFEKFYDSKRKRSKNLDVWAFDKVDTDNDQKISEQEMVNALMKNMKTKK